MSDVEGVLAIVRLRRHEPADEVLDALTAGGREPGGGDPAHPGAAATRAFVRAWSGISMIDAAR